ncbi:hypothetical protein LINGRAHAP2_LOCUS32125 [Linum grandiflorum]
MNHSWFLNKYQTPSQRSILEESDYYSKFNSLTSTFNAFDIISMSSGLDLSVKEVGKKLDYRVEEGKGGGAIGLEKGRVVFLFEAMEIAEKMVVAEVRIIGKRL